MMLTLGGWLPAGAAEEEESATELAKKTQNPVADLISVPFQNNFNFNTGEKDATVYLLNVQPVVPIKLTHDWTLITRTIVPIINQPSLFDGPNQVSGSAWGLGDINPSFFLSPARPSRFIWGVGPTFTLPTATDWRLGSGRFSLEPTAVALVMEGPWVAGALINNQWSVAGWGDKDVNQMFLQPFVNYNIADGWYVTTGPIITADWKAESGQRWTVPVGAGCSSWASCRSTRRSRATTTLRGPGLRPTGSCGSSCSSCSRASSRPTAGPLWSRAGRGSPRAD